MRSSGPINLAKCGWPSSSSGRYGEKITDSIACEEQRCKVI